jgi:hypothetical protein
LSQILRICGRIAWSTTRIRPYAAQFLNRAIFIRKSARILNQYYINKTLFNIQRSAMKKLLTALCLVAGVLPAIADEPMADAKGTWWANFGAGPGVLTSHTADNADDDYDSSRNLSSISINYAHFSNQFIELRVSNLGHFIDFSCFVSCEEQLNKLQDIGLLYGIMKKEKWYTLGASVGLAYTDIEYKSGEKVYVPDGDYYTTEYTYRNSQTLGLPAEAQLFYTPFKYFGIGLIGYLNINTEASGVGAMLAIQLGNLRP